MAQSAIPSRRPRRSGVDHVLDWTSLRALAWWATGAFAFGVLLVVLHVSGVDTLRLTRDASQWAGGADYGLLSTTGLVLWGMSGATCMLTASVLRGGPRARYFAWTAGVVFLLLVDDGALLHEEVLPSIGIPEAGLYVVELALLFTWLVRFRAEILSSEWPLLLLAGACLGVSLLADEAHLSQTFEDYAKYVGIATLFFYVFREARRHLRPVDRRRDALTLR